MSLIEVLLLVFFVFVAIITAYMALSEKKVFKPFLGIAGWTFFVSVVFCLVLIAKPIKEHFDDYNKLKNKTDYRDIEVERQMKNLMEDIDRLNKDNQKLRETNEWQQNELFDRGYPKPDDKIKFWRVK